MELIELTRNLIDISSVTGSEAEIGYFLAGYLQSLRYRVELQEVQPARFNIIATTGSSPRFVISTHMDTVPPHIPSSEDEQNIFGRGACDAKGIIAAQLMAAERLRREGIDDIGLLFTVDEELDSRGARVANEHPFASQCCYLINGEPTNNKLASGTKGSLRLSIRTKGCAAHSAYPEQGESAIEKLLDVLASIRSCRWPADECLGETSCNIGVISGGTRANVIPAEAQADLQIRLVTESEQIKQMLEQAIDGRAQVQYSSEHQPMRLFVPRGFASSAVRFTTDIPYLTNWGTPLLVGPGSILAAHTAHEHVAKSDLAEAVELYVRLVSMLAGKDLSPGCNSQGDRVREHEDQKGLSHGVQS